MKEPKISASEALLGFCGWLTSRKEKTIMSSTDDAAPIVELIKQFMELNDLEDPREDYADFLTPTP